MAKFSLHDYINKLSAALTNAKTRTIVLFTGGLLVTGVIVAIVSSGKTGEPLEAVPSQTTGVPAGVVSTPGAVTSERYRELQQEANIKGAQKAEQTGETFVPTIVGDQPEQPKKEDVQAEFLQALGSDATKLLREAGVAVPQVDPNAAELEAIRLREAEAEAALRRQRLADAESERLMAMSEHRVKQIEQVSQAMEQQTAAAFSAWNSAAPVQQYVVGSWAEQKEAKKKAMAEIDASKVEEKPVIMKAGSILFAALETAVNSDEPGPVLARIVQGSLKGSKLIGSIEISAEGEKIALKFDTINIPTEHNSMKISAVAIDPDTARTALASDVDYHYFLRWGSLFASSFLEGYSKAVGESGTTVQTSTAPGSATSTTNKQALNGRQQIFEGLGTVGERWSEAIAKNFERKPTITIDSGIGIGVLLTADLKLGEKPEEINRFTRYSGGQPVVSGGVGAGAAGAGVSNLPGVSTTGVGIIPGAISTGSSGTTGVTNTEQTTK